MYYCASEFGSLDSLTKWIVFPIPMYSLAGDICRNQLQKITCPTLVLHGQQDPLIPKEHAEYIAKNIKNSE